MKKTEVIGHPSTFPATRGCGASGVSWEESRPPGSGYSVRESSRARRVILRVLPQGRLEVVVPKGFDRKKLPEIVGEHSQWIEQAMQRVASKYGHTVLGPTPLPEEVRFRAVGLRFVVQVNQTADATLRLIQRPDHRLELVGNCPGTDAYIVLLRRWLRYQGRLHLIPWLEAVAGRVGMGFGSVQVRSQKSRWGSCSSRGTISLNECLLFLPGELVRYIMVHELCHIRHLNHSESFWRLVAAHEPDFKILDARMNDGRTFVPRWAGGGGD